MEMADVLLYLIQMGNELGVNVAEAAQQKNRLERPEILQWIRPKAAAKAQRIVMPVFGADKHE